MAGAAGIVAPLVVGAAVAVGVGWRAGLLVTRAAGRRPATRCSTASAVPASPDGRPGRPPGRRAVAAAAVLAHLGVVVCTVGVEFCLSLWCQRPAALADRDCRRRGDRGVERRCWWA